MDDAIAKMSFIVSDTNDHTAPNVFAKAVLVVLIAGIPCSAMPIPAPIPLIQFITPVVIAEYAVSLIFILLPSMTEDKPFPMAVPSTPELGDKRTVLLSPLFYSIFLLAVKVFRENSGIYYGFRDDVGIVPYPIHPI